MQKPSQKKEIVNLSESETATGDGRRKGQDSDTKQKWKKKKRRKRIYFKANQLKIKTQRCSCNFTQSVNQSSNQSSEKGKVIPSTGSPPKTTKENPNNKAVRKVYSADHKKLKL